MQKEKNRLLELLKKHAFRRGKVTLASGKVSDFYIDAKQVTLNPEGLYLTARIMLEMLKGVEFDAVGGLTIGADPIVAAIGVVSRLEQRNMQVFIVRKEAKKHGMQKFIEGPSLQPGSKVVIVEDVMTSGGSALKAIKAVEAAKCRVVKVIALVDRMDGARETLKQKNYELLSVFTRNDITK
jgi:orotate phosphoribosyltransferase